jgi:putative ABC transport system ATP-binding protein
VVVAGKSGAGKSTLLNILAGLDTPSSGAVFFHGRRTDSLSGDERAILRKRCIGIVFQSHNLISSWTARENLEGPLLHSEVAPRERRRRSDSWLRALELEDRACHFLSELSLGQQQRLAIGRTLIHSPTLVFADEPTGDLDPEAARLLLDLLCAPVRERGMALVVMTHGSFPGKADRTFVLAGGRLQTA